MATNFDAVSVNGNNTPAWPNTFAGPIQEPHVLLSGVSATIAYPNGNTTYTITTGSAIAITLNPPVVGGPGVGQDGIIIRFFSETAFAHQLTCSQGFNRKGASGTATASAAANNSISMYARNGQINVLSNVNFTIA